MKPWDTDDAIITDSDIIGDAQAEKKNVQGSLIPLANSLVFFRVKIDFIAQNSCFSVLAAHLGPFVSTTVGGREGPEGIRQAQGWPSLLGGLYRLNGIGMPVQHRHLFCLSSLFPSSFLEWKVVGGLR